MARTFEVISRKDRGSSLGRTEGADRAQTVSSNIGEPYAAALLEPIGQPNRAREVVPMSVLTWWVLEDSAGDGEGAGPLRVEPSLPSKVAPARGGQ